MKATIFYSWQSDLNSKSNRFFEDFLKMALKFINKDDRIIACIVRDNKKELGSPNIQSSVFRKNNH